MVMTTSKYIYSYKYPNLPGGVFVTPFPNAHHYGMEEEACVEFCLKQLDLLLHAQTAPDEVAGIVLFYFILFKKKTIFFKKNQFLTSFVF